MYYIQYYERGAVTGNLIEACGDRAVILLDGRETLETHKDIARTMNGENRPKYAAYQIRKGESFIRSHNLTPVIHLNAPQSNIV